MEGKESKLPIQKVSDQPITNREEKIVYGLIGAVFCLSVIIGLYGAVPLPKVYVFACLTNIALTIAALQTSLLLYGQSKIVRDGSLAILASGYSVSGLFALAYVLFYPGLFFSFTGESHFYNESAAWLSIFGHANFSLAIIFYTLFYAQRIKLDFLSPEFVFRSSFVYALVFISTSIYCQNYLPNIIDGDSYHFTVSAIIGFTLIFLGCCSAFCVIRYTNLSSRHNLWLLLAVIIHILEIVYGVVGKTRYSLGWYTARVSQVLSFSIILGVFTYHLTYLTRKLSEANKKLEEIATMDFLTKINNRRKFITTLDNYWELAQRERKPLCLIMIDIDHFKIYNDTFGHLAGDDCLILVAQELKRIFKRHTDVISRIGGEEFAVLLYNVGEKEGKKIAEKIRRSIENLKLKTYSTKQPHITVSVGCAAIIPNKQLDPTFIIDVADQALYEAKFRGRNKVIATSFSYGDQPSFFT